MKLPPVMHGHTEKKSICSDTAGYGGSHPHDWNTQTYSARFANTNIPSPRSIHETIQDRAGR